MRFSVIVPVYNVEAYLKTCVDSVIAQTCSDYELILVDDGSTDHSGALCDRLAAKTGCHVVHQENGGLGAARNTIWYSSTAMTFSLRMPFPVFRLRLTDALPISTPSALSPTMGIRISLLFGISFPITLR